MATKPKKSKVVTKKEISRSRKEKNQQRILVISSITVFVIIFLVILFGILNTYVFMGMKPVATVGNEKITLNQYREYGEYYRYNQVKNYMNQYLQYAWALDNSPYLADLFVDYLDKAYNFLESSEQRETFGETILNEMINNVIIRKEAEKLGISISDEEFDSQIEKFFSYFPEGTSTPTLTATPYVTSTMSALQYEMVSATPEPTETSTPEAEEEVAEETEEEPTATLEPTEEVVEEAAADEEEVEAATETPVPTATFTATPYTEELFEGNQEDYYSTLEADGYQSNQFKNIQKDLLLRNAVFEYVTKDLEPFVERVWARHILVSDVDTANEVLEKLENGEDWSDLAIEYSIDTNNNTSGGDLGWFASGDMVEDFENAAFSMEVGETSEPVKTDFGWHIIQVIGHEDQPVSQSVFEQMKDDYFDNWLEEKKLEYNVEKTDLWKGNIPVEPAVPYEYIFKTPVPTTIPSAE